MALSPNYGWAEPDNSSLVKNGAQDIRALGDAIDTSLWNVGFGQAGKNKIINGDFGVWQRGTSFSNPANEAYLADRFNIVFDGSGSTRTVSQQTFTPGTAPVAGYESQYFIRMAQTVAGTGGSYVGYNQRIEDVRTFAGQTITLSFWAKADATRTILPNLQQNFGSGGSTTVNITSGFTSTNLTTSWARYTFTVSVPSISGKTVGTSSFLQLYFGFAANTVQTIDIWGVQLEYGSKATPFETATGTIQGELAACQRYFFRLDSSSNVYSVFANGHFNTTTNFRTILPFPMTMRSTPTFSFSNMNLFAGNGASFLGCSAGTPTASTMTKNASVIDMTVTGATAGQGGMLIANNSTSAFIEGSAEL